jgi:hypothetical protein
MIRQNIVDEDSSSEESGLPGMISDTSSSGDSDQEVRERENTTATSLELQEVRQILDRAPNTSCDNIVDHQQRLANLHGGRSWAKSSQGGAGISFVDRTTDPVYREDTSDDSSGGEEEKRTVSQGQRAVRRTRSHARGGQEDLSQARANAAGQYLSQGRARENLSQERARGKVSQERATTNLSQ